MVALADSAAYSSTQASEGIRWAACTNCSQQPPTMATGVVSAYAGSVGYGASVIAIGDAGLAVAWTSGLNLGAQNGSLHYTECAGDCAAGGTWTDVVVDQTDPEVMPPQMVITSGGVRAIAVSMQTNMGGGGTRPRGVLYVECSSDCTSVGSWTEGWVEEAQGNGQPPTYRPGLALLDTPDGGLLRMVTDQQGYFECASNCTPGIHGGGNWVGGTAGGMGLMNGDQMMALTAAGLPEIASVNGNQIQISTCTGAPCTSVLAWTEQQLSVNASSPEIGFETDSQGLGVLLFTGSTNELTLDRQTVVADGGLAWIASPVVACGGATVLGEYASMALTPAGGLRIQYANLGLTDGGTTHSIYSLGP